MAVAMIICCHHHVYWRKKQFIPFLINHLHFDINPRTTLFLHSIHYSIPLCPKDPQWKYLWFMCRIDEIVYRRKRSSRNKQLHKYSNHDFWFDLSLTTSIHDDWNYGWCSVLCALFIVTSKDGWSFYSAYLEWFYLTNFRFSLLQYKW